MEHGSVERDVSFADKKIVILARTMVRIGITVPSGSAHKVWVGRVVALGTRPLRPASSPAVSARLYLDRMAEILLKQFLPSVCITY